MKPRHAFVFTAALASPLALPDVSRAQEKPSAEVRLEGGALFVARNVAAIPGDSGTRFSLKQVLGSGPFEFVRATYLRPINRRDGIRLLYAPLSISKSGTLSQTTNFAGKSFAASVPTRAEYTFNSYRASWYRTQNWRGWDSARLGVTIKVRDANISLSQGNVSGNKYDLGFVPLFHVSGERTLSPKWRLLLDFDGLAAPQGRAFDLGLSAGYALNSRATLTIGYRLLDGGADNDEVYNFALVHYATAGIAWKL